MAPDLKEALEQALNGKVTATKDQQKQILTKASLGIEQLVNQYARGDRYARRDLIDYVERLGVDLAAGSRKAIEDALTPNHQAILDAYLQRRTGAADVAPSAPVIAPPALLDDDVVKHEPTSAAQPAAAPKPAPQRAAPEAVPARPAQTPDLLHEPSTELAAQLMEVAPSPALEPPPKLKTTQRLRGEPREMPSGQAPSPSQPNATASSAPLPSPTAEAPASSKSEDFQSGSKPLPLPPKPKHPPGGATRESVNALREWNFAVQRIQQSSSET